MIPDPQRRLPPGSSVRTASGRLGIVESYVPNDAMTRLHSDCPGCNCNRPTPYQGFAIVRWLDSEHTEGGIIRVIPQQELDEGYQIDPENEVRSYEWPGTMMEYP